jgi:hypothetical protein
VNKWQHESIRRIGSTEFDSHPGGGKCRYIQLTFGPNIQQAATKRDGHCQPGKD